MKKLISYIFFFSQFYSYVKLNNIRSEFLHAINCFVFPQFIKNIINQFLIYVLLFYVSWNCSCLFKIKTGKPIMNNFKHNSNNPHSFIDVLFLFLFGYQKFISFFMLHMVISLKKQINIVV